jgi:hypothetical protein
MNNARFIEKQQRAAHANDLVKIISDHGRRFFYNANKDRVAGFSVAPSGHIYFTDDYTGTPIYVAYQGRWRGWSHGGTLRELIRRMARYINTGKRLSLDWIGPERFDQSNIWGYTSDEMTKCRTAALECAAIEPDHPATAPVGE